ncbi:MAG TPA: SAM-dependent methyltransferase [Candidatus Angelobacter sp.]|nr:SAM-dependent methyltransferase [Candidatus Angelobacter sp.]
MSKIIEKIAATIRAEGAISFARFMELALYCPDCGFYEKEEDNIGKSGDFFTSVSVGNLFGQLLAFQFDEWLHAEAAGRSTELRIVEAGAHNGQLAYDILTWLREHRNETFRRLEYYIVEPSEHRRKWQREKLKDFGNVIKWLTEISDLKTVQSFGENPPERSISSPSPPRSGGLEPLGKRRKEFAEQRPERAERAGASESLGRGEAALRAQGEHHLSSSTQLLPYTIIFSNELLDAMPLHRFGWDAREKKWFEWGVALNSEKFIWSRLKNPSLVPPLSGLESVLPDGYIIETSPAAEKWWREASEALTRGKLMAIDYGFTAEEQFLPARAHGTLRAYHRHQVTHDILANPGEQDITAHVNFSTIQKTGEEAGLWTEAFCTQPRFLTRIVEKIFKQPGSCGEWAPKQTREFQTLTHPEHLGRGFRVLVQSSK